MDPISSINLASSPAIREQLLQRFGSAASSPVLPAGDADSMRQLSGAAGLQGSGAVQQGSFANLLGNMVQEVSAKQAAAGQAMEGMLAGEGVSLHQAMIAMEEANVSFQLMVEVRNKLLESYQELMRMQI